jgi:hypothetical protein
MQFARDIVRRYHERGGVLPRQKSDYRKTTVTKVLPDGTTVSTVASKISSEESQQEYKDARKLHKWRQTLKGNGNGHNCPDEIRDFLDRELVNWRDNVKCRSTKKAKDSTSSFNNHSQVSTKSTTTQITESKGLDNTMISTNGYNAECDVKKKAGTGTDNISENSDDSSGRRVKRRRGSPGSTSNEDNVSSDGADEWNESRMEDVESKSQMSGNEILLLAKHSRPSSSQNHNGTDPSPMNEWDSKSSYSASDEGTSTESVSGCSEISRGCKRRREYADSIVSNESADSSIDNDIKSSNSGFEEIRSSSTSRLSITNHYQS